MSRHSTMVFIPCVSEHSPSAAKLCLRAFSLSSSFQFSALNHSNQNARVCCVLRSAAPNERTSHSNQPTVKVAIIAPNHHHRHRPPRRLHCGKFNLHRSRDVENPRRDQSPHFARRAPTDRPHGERQNGAGPRITTSPHHPHHIYNCRRLTFSAQRRKCAHIKQQYNAASPSLLRRNGSCPQPTTHRSRSRIDAFSSAACGLVDLFPSAPHRPLSPRFPRKLP